MPHQDPDPEFLDAARSLAGSSDLAWDNLKSGSPDSDRALQNLRELADLAAAFQNHQAEPEIAEPEVLFEWGHLRVLEPLGQGSYGEVFKAFDIVLERNVALKLRHREASQQARTYLQEARRLARVRHPNVVAVHGADIHDGRAGIWTDLISGATVESVLSEHQALADGQILDAGLALARALEAVHAKNLVHGDVKAANVMIERSGTIILMDFGAGSESGRAGRQTEGSPLVMAPERLMSAVPHPAADIYSLGVLLFRLFAQGRYPIEAESLQALVDHHAQGKASVSLRSLNPAVHRHWVRLIETMLSPDPEDRPTAPQCIERLEWIRDLPRRRRRYVVVGVIVGSLALGALFAGMGYLRATKSESDAVAARDRAEAITGFLQDTLATPNQDLEGFEITVATVLEDAGARLQAGEFAGDPIRHAAILETMARTYNVLAKHLLAEPLGQKALELFKLHRGAQAPETLRASLTYGMTLGQLGRYEQARALHQSTLAAARDSLGPDHRLTLLVAARLANVMDSLSQADEARELLQSVLAQSQATLLDEEAAFARGLVQRELGQLLTRTGEFSQALPVLSAAYEQIVARYGATHYRVVPIRHALSNVYIELGQLDLAEAHLRQNLTVIEQRDAVFTPDGASTLSSLSMALYNQGKFLDALPISERALATSKAVFPPGHLTILKLQGNLANLYKDMDRVEQAEENYREVIQAISSSLSDTHHVALLNRTNLVELLVEEYRYAESLDLAQETLDLQARALGENHLFTLYTLDLVARSHAGLGDHAAAKALLRDAIARKQQHLGVDSPYVIDSQLNLAEILLSQGNYQEAKSLLRQAERAATAVLGESHPKTKRAAQMLQTIQ